MATRALSEEIEAQPTLTATQGLREEFEIEPYKGDDWAQSLARTMWWPMLAMGAMLVLGALAFGSYSGVKLGNFFHLGTPAVDDFGTGQSVTAWATGLNFFGMGFILSGITMVLVNIVRTLRDAGRDVQGAVHADEVLKLRKPWEGKALPHVMMMGLMILGVGLAFGAVVATKLGTIPAAELAQGAGVLTGENLARFGAAQSITAWVGPLRFVGLAAIFGSIVLALRVITKTLRYQSFRLVELSEETASRVERERPRRTSRANSSGTRRRRQYAR